MCAIIKHTNPLRHGNWQDSRRSLQTCVGVRSRFRFRRRHWSEPARDLEAAEEMHKLFLEVIAAPAFDEAAKAKFASKKN